MYNDYDNKDKFFYEKGELSSLLAMFQGKVKEEINGFEENYLLNVNEDDLAKSIISKFTLEPPSLRQDLLHGLEPEEIDIEGIDEWLHTPYSVKGTLITIVVPFEGDKNLFYYIPSSRSFTLVSGNIRNNELFLTYKIRASESGKIEGLYKSDLQNIENSLLSVKRDVGSYNSSLPDLIQSLIKNRKQKLLNDRSIVSSLNIPIKTRGDSSQTFSIPPIKEKINIELPKAKADKFEPEPTLDNETYEKILSTLEDMSLVMERSPKAISKMNEEEIRDMFLIQLNSRYGESSGETFNYQGKTDILIKHEGKNIFIAECKFWKGEKVFLETITQLLSYATWRDTKTAVLVFNKNKNLSEVLNTASEVTKKHSNFKNEISISGETRLRYVFGLPQDNNREVIVTVMFFDIPDVVKT